MSGFIHRQVLPASRNRHSHKSNPHPFNDVQVSHDPDSKIVLAKGTKFKNVFTKTCLMKTYPQVGRYAGGIVFRRCYSVGEGVGFTKEECAKMWGDVKLDDHIMLVGGGTTTTTNTPTSTTATINTPTISPSVTMQTIIPPPQPSTLRQYLPPHHRKTIIPQLLTRQLPPPPPPQLTPLPRLVRRRVLSKVLPSLETVLRCGGRGKRSGLPASSLTKPPGTTTQSPARLSTTTTKSAIGTTWRLLLRGLEFSVART